MIYVIKTEDDSAIKIGFTKTKEGVNRRLCDLQIGNHIKLTVIHTFKGGRSYEKLAHGFLHQYHLTGEWFDYSNFAVRRFVSILIESEFIEAIRSLTENKEYKLYSDIQARTNRRSKLKHQRVLKLETNLLHAQQNAKRQA